MQGTVCVSAPAKVNLFLSIGDVRSDGYHEVTTVTQTISLADVLTLEPADRLELACATNLGVPVEENLAFRAATCAGEAVGRAPHVRIVLEKRIPAGAGLAGGSSDAAAVIAGLARLWELDAADDRLLAAAAGVGADVPLFLLGGTNLMGGRGDELIERLPPVECGVVVVWPEVSVSTADAYRAFDAAPRQVSASPDAMVAACASGSCGDVARVLHNNMTDPSVGLVPAIADALAWVRAADETLGAVMAGSGSGVCAVCRSESDAGMLAARARAEGWWAREARTLSSGAVVVQEKGRS